ncbi:Uncharacterised protein [uncultured Clostridium sp.]|nr:Uncharacterised protein [uncultured Clostridium sp.]
MSKNSKYFEWKNDLIITPTNKIYCIYIKYIYFL